MHVTWSQRASVLQRGFALIESLIAITLLGFTIIAVSKLHLYTLHANGAVRNYASVAGGVRAVIDNYRGLDLNTLLNKFSLHHLQIPNGATVTESVPAADRHVAYEVRLTAVRSASEGAPEAVRVQVSATQTRGKLGAQVFQYETLISQAS